MGYRIFLRVGGASVDSCYQKVWEVREEDFEVAIVGMGMFQREKLILRFPFLKWREMRCGAVQTYISAGGLAGLDQIPYNWDFSVQVVFQTEQGVKLEASDTFRP